MKTDYASHDDQYKKRRAAGLPGWDSAEVLAENLALQNASLQAEYIPKQGKVLELGCGAGDRALFMAERGFQASGVDISPFAVQWAQEKARERGLKVDFRVGNVLDLADYPDDHFDLVLDGHCFHCIIGEHRKLFLAAALRALKQGGLFQVKTMCGEPVSEGFQRTFDPVSRCQVINGVAYRYCGLPEDILNEIRESGFHILHWKVFKQDDGEGEDMLLVDAAKLPM